jgi:hypothetical protein
MATRTSVGTGLWSAAGTWDGAVPVNGDTVIIAVGHTVTFDVSQSGFANGLAALTINGILSFKPDSDTYLKMNGNLTGTGELWVGTEANPITRQTAGSEYRAMVMFNASSTIELPTIKMYGWHPTIENTTLLLNASAGQPVMVLKDDIGLQAGDIIWVQDSTVYTPSAESSKGIYTVQSYNSATRTVTLTGNLETRRFKGDELLIYNRPIKFTRSSGTTALYSTAGPHSNLTLVGVSLPSVINGSTNYQIINSVISHCTFSCASYSFYNIIDMTLSNCIFKNTNYVLRYGTGITVEDSYLINGCAVSYFCSPILFSNCSLINGYSLNYSLCTGARFKNVTAKNSRSVFNSGGAFYNCNITDHTISYGEAMQSNGGCPYYLFMKDCIFDLTEDGYVFYGMYGKFYNCLFNVEPRNHLKLWYEATPGMVLESFNHNQIPGNYKAWCRGGNIETEEI